MEQTLKIKIGKEIPLINKIGGLIFLIGIILFLSTGIILYAGTHLPFEMKIIYYIEIIHKNIYLTFTISIILLLVGLNLSECKKFVRTDLHIDDEGLIFYHNKEKIELPHKKIHRIIKKKGYLIPGKKITIRTIRLKRYEVKMDNLTYKMLVELYPDKLYFSK